MDVSEHVMMAFASPESGLVASQVTSNGGEDAMAILLLVLLLKILAIGGVFLIMAIQVIRQRNIARRHADYPEPDDWITEDQESTQLSPTPDHILALQPPQVWMAINQVRLNDVDNVLGLRDLRSREWDASECLSSDDQLFISPPVESWTLVFGNALHLRFSDPDQIFHYIRRVSRSFGTVQYYSVCQATGYHCWVNAHSGRIIRGYIWDGQTQWNHGQRTRAEKKLNLMTLDYLTPLPRTSEPSYGSMHPGVLRNCDMIYNLAGMWGVNPMLIDISHWDYQNGIQGSL